MLLSRFFLRPMRNPNTSYPMLDSSSQGQKINKELRFKPSILAYDADLEINSPVQYAITTGNERGLFYINPTNGSLFLKKEIDLEKETSLIGNIFLLQIQASQVYKSRTINLIIFFVQISQRLHLSFCLIFFR